MGGAAFPAHVKYSIPDGQQIDELLVNGAECEPYLTNDHRLMMERPQALLRGVEILMTQLGAKRTTIGVESNKPEAIAAHLFSRRDESFHLSYFIGTEAPRLER